MESRWSAKRSGAHNFKSKYLSSDALMFDFANALLWFKWLVFNFEILYIQVVLGTSSLVCSWKAAEFMELILLLRTVILHVVLDNIYLDAHVIQHLFKFQESLSVIDVYI